MSRTRDKSASGHACPLSVDAGARDVADRLADSVRGNLPKGLSSPALRALASAGYTNLGQLTGASKKDLLKLHGMGPKAIRIIQDALIRDGRRLKS